MKWMYHVLVGLERGAAGNGSPNNLFPEFLQEGRGGPEVVQDRNLADASSALCILNAFLA